MAPINCDNSYFPSLFFSYPFCLQLTFPQIKNSNTIFFKLTIIVFTIDN
jgi:hypothetical protein